MHVYRIAPIPFSRDLSGTGAKLFGGRWNEKGTPCIYTSSTRALAICEFVAHQTLETVPNKLELVTLEIPTNSLIDLSIESLPSNWKDSPAPFKLKSLGNNLLINLECLIIKVPSAIVPEEFNYILNPLHDDFSKIRIVDKRHYSLDKRLL